jgi:hypothetical protein
MAYSGRHNAPIAGGVTVTVVWTGGSAGQQPGTAYLILAHDVAGVKNITIGGRPRSIHFKHGVASIAVNTNPATTMTSNSSVQVVDLNQAPPQPNKPLSLHAPHPFRTNFGCLAVTVGETVGSDLLSAPHDAHTIQKRVNEA